jgi:hypothetical protein
MHLCPRAFFRVAERLVTDPEWQRFAVKEIAFALDAARRSDQI